MASWRGRFAPASRERRGRLSAIRAPGRCFPDFYRALAPTCRLDTHAFAFLWLVAGDERLPATARTMIEDAEEVLLSTASVWEAEIKRAAGQLDAPAIAGAARRARVAQLAITSRHATVAAHLPMHHRDPFDRMIVAQTRVESLVLVSKDEAVRRYGVAAAGDRHRSVRSPATIHGMDSPSTTVRVKVDGQGRMVLPRWLRHDIVAVPGEVVLRRTPDGVLLTPVTSEGQIEQAPDGLPVLRLGRRVSNDEVIAAIDDDRAGR